MTWNLCTQGRAAKSSTVVCWIKRLPVKIYNLQIWVFFYFNSQKMLLKLIKADWVQIKLNNQQFSLLFKSICENWGINISIFQGSMQQAVTDEKQCLSDTYRYVVERFKLLWCRLWPCSLNWLPDHKRHLNSSSWTPSSRSFYQND